MLYYRMIMALITKGRVTGLKEKINVLWLDGELSDSQRDELIGKLPSA